MSPENRPSTAAPKATRLASHVEAITRELELLSSDIETVEADCGRLDALIRTPPSRLDTACLEDLARLAATHDDPAAEPLIRLIETRIPAMKRPWPILRILFDAASEDLQMKAVEQLFAGADDGRVKIDATVIETLAELFRDDDGLAADPDAVLFTAGALRRVLRGASRGGGDPLADRFVTQKNPNVRDFLARLLDREGRKLTRTVARTVLGAEAHDRLKSYLEYTDAGYRDLLAARTCADTPGTLDAFARAEIDAGASRVRDVVSLVGWDRIGKGLRFRTYRKIVVPGSLPLYVSPEQAALFRGTASPDQSGDVLLAIAQGGAPAVDAPETSDEDPIGRFRSMNIIHAELLNELLDVSPLDPAKIERIVAHMDRIVEDYTILFASVSKEVRILGDVYDTLKRRLREEMTPRGGRPVITADVTRLVQMFEDPGSLADVRTIHGLKRYLHQTGLGLGLELVDTCRSPAHNVDLVLFSDGADPVLVQSIQFTEFESEREVDPDPWLSYPIRIVVEGYVRQLLHGQRSFPDINAFIFGNEGHYYIAFRNHPAFLRIDFSPPQRGGMIDLQFLGISNYELDIHPGKDLTAIRLFMRKLGFDVKLSGIRVMARYDKETCPDLGDLSAKAESLFRLSPYLMNLDWSVASLDLPPEARRKAAKAWAARFEESGVLPLADILPDGGQHVIRDVASGPSGLVVSTWDGESPYADLFSEPYPQEMVAALDAQLDRLGLPTLDPGTLRRKRTPGLLDIERLFLDPVSAALAHGRVVFSDDTLEIADSDRFRIVHPAAWFARLLSAGGPPVDRAMGLSSAISMLERFVAFTTVGFVGALEIQSAGLKLRGGAVKVYALRDDLGVVRMGLFTSQPGITLVRSGKGARWRAAVESESGLWSLLLGANYVTSAPDPVAEDSGTGLAELRALASRRIRAADRDPREGRRTLGGLPASPGRVTGRAVFDASRRDAEDLRGCIIVTHEVRPEDADRLLQGAGFISTGGSVLSHASLLAMQFGKPALMVKAEILTGSGRRKELAFESPIAETTLSRRHGLEVGTRRIVGLRSDAIVDGDLIVLNADEGEIGILGQDRDALDLYEGFRMLNEACRRSREESDSVGIMEVRAQKLRSRHILEKVLDRLADPVLGEFAVEEISLGRSFAQVQVEDRVHLMARLLENETTAPAVKAKLVEIEATLDDRLESAVDTALERIPGSYLGPEILHLRLRAIQAREALDGVTEMLEGCGLAPPGATAEDPAERITSDARARLSLLRERAIDALAGTSDGDGIPAARRHHLRRTAWLDSVLGSPGSRQDEVRAARRALERADARALERARDVDILPGVDCGHELAGLIGWKAANLGELMRLDEPSAVPPWCVITNRALLILLKQPVAAAAERGNGDPTPSLRKGIGSILGRDDLDNARKSALIRQLWESVELPGAVERDVRAAYADLVRDAASEDVALRSSSSDEDTETDMRAGEYETYLHVRGADSVCEHLKLTWAGLWSERALYARQRSGDIAHIPAAGVVMQVMIDARASGVVQTANIPRENYREIVVNAGLGLGEGVVSGRVSTDMITVVKNPDPEKGSLRINYITSDKTEQVVRSKRRGGTRLVETLYHQRQRPALEYLELAELVQKSLHLEAAYGYPLDLEFAIEGTRIHLLQARPLAAPAGVLRETLEHHPLRGSDTGESK